MNERVAFELKRSFGTACVSVARTRFDGVEVPLLAPNTTAGFCEALALAHRENWVVVPTGLGSKLSWTKAPARVDFLLSTRAYAGVVAYEPGDGTLTARAGTTMAELSSRVASGGHALTPDVPRPARATLGGVIAAAQSGSDRLRYGPVRDHVLGVQVALGDGTLARSGGRLVKNVTGYDLQRLFTGSHGSLCVILEASMRLFALPEEECVFSALAADQLEMLRLAALVLEAPLRPISVRAYRADRPAPTEQWMVAVHLGGRREVLADEQATLTKLWPACHVACGPQARSEVESQRDNLGGFDDGPLLRIEVSPQSIAPALEVVLKELHANGDSKNFHPRCEPGLALIEIALRPSAHDAQQLARMLNRLQSALATVRGHARLLHAPANALTEAAGEPPAGFALMQRIRAQLDPGGVFASGRFLEAR